METKVCSKCKAEKPVSDFYRSNKYKCGRISECIPCCKAHQAGYRERTREAHRNRTAKHRARYRAGEQPQPRPVHCRTYEELLASRRVVCRIANLNHYARSKGVRGRLTVRDWYNALERYGHRCLACGRSEDEAPLTIDHVNPFYLGGPNTGANIQVLCMRCNQSKGTRRIDYRRQEEQATLPL